MIEVLGTLDHYSSRESFSPLATITAEIFELCAVASGHDNRIRQGLRGTRRNKPAGFILDHNLSEAAHTGCNYGKPVSHRPEGGRSQPFGPRRHDEQVETQEEIREIADDPKAKDSVRAGRALDLRSLIGLGRLLAASTSRAFGNLSVRGLMASNATSRPFPAWMRPASPRRTRIRRTATLRAHENGRQPLAILRGPRCRRVSP